MKKPIFIFLFIVFYAGYLIFTKLLFGDNNLVVVKGKFPQHDKMIATDTYKEDSIELAKLIFRLDRDERIYTVQTVITGIKNGANVFSGVVFSLREAGEIEIYIRKAEIAAPAPKVYQIKADGKEIFHILKKPGNNSRLFLILLLFILLFCSAYYWLQCLSIPPKKSNRKPRWHFNF